MLAQTELRIRLLASPSWPQTAAGAAGDDARQLVEAATRRSATPPDSLLTLDLGGFNSAIPADFRWPPHLTTLRWSCFNQPLQGVRLPNSLTDLSFGRAYSHSLDGVHLPASLQVLRFDPVSPFKHSLDTVQWPAGMRSLSMPSDWNQPVAGLRLPDLLTHLYLGTGFFQSLRDWHPPASLSDFKLDHCQGEGWGAGMIASDLRLPAKLSEFKIPYEFAVVLADLTLPASLKSLTLDWQARISDPSRLPAGLTSLNLGYSSISSLDGMQWPPHLMHLNTGAFNRPLLNWSPPASLTHLQLGHLHIEGWNLPVSQLRLPPNLQRLEFGDAFDQPLSGLQWPASLTSLACSTSEYARFNQPLRVDDVPSSLRHLHLGPWNRPVRDLALPPQLESLSIGSAFEGDVSTLRLPNSLRRLQLDGEGPKDLHQLKLPAGVRELSLAGSTVSRTLAELPAQLPASLRLIVVHAEHRRVWLQCLHERHLPLMQSGCAVASVE